MTPRYVVGFWCVKGGGHLALLSDEDYDGSCGNGWEVVLHDADPDDEGLPLGEWRT